MYAVFVLVPFLLTLLYSFYRWNGVGPMTWVGLKNYVSVFQVPSLISTVVNAFWLVVWFSFIPVGLGLIVASVIHRIASGAVRSGSPDSSIPAAGHSARRCRHHLGLAAGPSGLDQ